MTCLDEICERGAVTKGYCSKHYQSLRRKGLIKSSWKIKDTSKMGHSAPKSAFKKGHKTWNKGLADWLSSSQKKAISRANTGRTAWNKGRKMPETSGVNNHAWKGGKKNENEIQRTRFRKYFQPLVLARDNYTCQICEQYSGYLQVDHIKKWSDFPELRFEMDNCRTLCMSCHYYITFKRKMPEGIIWGHNLSRRIAS